MPSRITNLFVGIGCMTPIFGLVLLGYFFYNRSFLLGIVSLVVCFFAAIILFGVIQQIEDRRKKEQLEFLQTFQPDQFDFNKHKSFTSYDLLSKIAIDDQQKKVYLWMPVPKKGGNVTKAYAKMPYIINTYNFSDILAIYLKEDNYETASAQRDSHFTNFLLNKLNEEDVATGKAASEPVDKINSMDLEIITDDNSKPRHLIRFYHAPYTPLKKDSLEYAAHFKERQDWFAKLKFIIEQRNDIAREVERPIETIDPPLQAETPIHEISNEKTRITVEVDTNQYSLSLHEDSEHSLEENPEIKKAAPPEQELKKPSSYFEQLLEKNRRQLRGDYNDEEN